ncbi:DeoR/GlpR family DNA-binding transcription regulator [Bacillus haynesii]|uniref:DeoR/GlpR family DNA-binding transcription regulator n=1 Tax=Bacillus haynesii TaxID=1925021 RepID=A0AA90F6R5_9BACI|nr:DeoR/GlpR family DNA-binding transcription regulator [Bacillus haynesii]MCY7752425.1 DeoR/GlpR family DNA-binding transcription regulator [Bacillus haynesii]MCY7790034.1 DeoR/GlpR family DNA-binding transcription regulator [Bacillus haynesii]MCY7847565.1 DeoR/GlpR family DNA-binding transcription regulator [Bacillus haynesii]MCY7913432.1 DeoR/GlpR family DNA-binding transcription regulator [Bacillus haynesii]MCY7924279.1 DeoR/GlpR family DNA-binding transcription regulator [Bacillus haynesi
MYQEERLISIIDYLKEHKRISVEQICSLFGVSRDTARRDLVKLQEQGAIIRTRGGAIMPTVHDEVKDYSGRLGMVSEEKSMIGKAAASLIREGDRIILDASTTVQSCAEHLPDVNCTIITNSINLADVLSSRKGADIHLLGGKLQKEHRFLYGASVIEKLSCYHVDKALIGVVGVSEHGLTIAHEEDGMVKRKMISQAKQVIALADHSKIGRTDFYRYAELSDIDLLITDRLPSKPFQKLLDEHDVELLVAEHLDT